MTFRRGRNTRERLSSLAAATLAGLAIAAAPAARSASPAADFSAWDDIERFRGRYESRRFTVTDHHVPHYDEVGSEEHFAAVDFEIERTESGWRTVRSSVVGHSAVSNRTEAPFRKTALHSSTDYSGTSAEHDLHFDLDTDTGTWEFGSGGTLREPYVETVSLRREEDPGGGRWRTESWEQTYEKKYYAHGTVRGELPGAKPGTLHRTAETLDDERNAGNFDFTTGRNTWEVTLTPVWPDVEVVVKVEGLGPKGEAIPYEEWLPRGTRSGEAGARLKASARLQGRDGKPVRVEAKAFRFELRNASREPGVCMNFPRVGGGGGKGAPADPPLDPEFDLRFDAGRGGTDGKRQVQRLEPRRGPDGKPSAETVIECFDFGAWGELAAVAELRDGREIAGHLEGAPSVSVIKIPQRSGLSLIADAWKKDRQVKLPDGDDGEDDPAGDGRAGDGLTLYEEYRGFLENGEHLRGDPKKKELFIGNRIGADAAGGIELFTLVTGLTVHSLMLPDELGDDRLVNPNRGRGPRRTVQHGVVMETEPRIDGGLAFDPKDRPPGPPKTTEKLLMGPMVNAAREDGGFFARDRGLRPSDQIFLYDAVLAHELLHCVSVWHHGEGDFKQFFSFTIPGVEKEYPAGVFLGDKDPKTSKYKMARILAEDGRDLAKAIAERYQGKPDLVRLLASLPGPMPTRLDLIFVEGVPQGQHSGSDTCLMRYLMAQIYASKKRPDLYYLTGGERPGYGLCDSPLGTGVNGSRSPESRFEGAKPGRGDCAHQICVSDAYEAKIR